MEATRTAISRSHDHGALPDHRAHLLRMRVHSGDLRALPGGVPGMGRRPVLPDSACGQRGWFLCPDQAQIGAELLALND